MIKFEKIQTDGFPLYVVESSEDWNKFTNWLYDLEDLQMSLSFEGNIYRFKSMEERRFFVLGFSKAWDLLDDMYRSQQ